ncbi:hypothetical protein [Afifella pfennigii]|uniref:hypothetical protein n=1 Tax=Afifella pfennigii TaxID=209897 RepID=UPI00047EFC03|nr:hypothetical protein [Afifella pfennigii]
MNEHAATARLLAAVPFQSGLGRRVVAADDEGQLHLISLRTGEDEGEPEMSFTRDGAQALAAAVLAGNAHAMTAPHTLRVLAAALLAREAGERRAG